MSDADKLVELAQQLFPPPPPKMRVVLRCVGDPPYLPEQGETVVPVGPHDNLLIIELVPLVAPERPAVVRQRTNGEGERYY